MVLSCGFEICLLVLKCIMIVSIELTCENLIKLFIGFLMEGIKFTLVLKTIH